MWNRVKVLPAIGLGLVMTATSVAFGLTALWEALPESLRGEPVPATMKTVLIHVQRRRLDEVEMLLRKLKSARGEVAVNAPERLLRITDRPWGVERMRRIVHEVDGPDVFDHSIWTHELQTTSADEAAQVLTRRLIDSPPRDVSKVVPANRERLLIIVANRNGYQRTRRFRFEGCSLTPAGLETVLIRVKHRDADAMARVLRDLTSERGEVDVYAPKRLVRVTDRPSEVERLRRIAREIDESDAPGQKIWVVDLKWASAEEMAARLNELFEGDQWPGVTLSKIIGAERERRLIIVGNEAGYARVHKLRPNGCPDPT